MTRNHTLVSLTLIALTAFAFGDTDPSASAQGRATGESVRVGVGGEVAAISGDRLRLGEGPDAILVDLEGIDYFDERRTWRGLRGERVMVYGRFAEGNRTIDASTVFLDELSSYVHAGPEAEAAFDRWSSPAAEEGTAGIRSRVVAIDGGVLRLAYPEGTFTVDTTDLPFDPLDDDGAVRISVGDRVEVWGSLEGDLFDEPTLVAADLTLIAAGARHPDE